MYSLAAKSLYFLATEEKQVMAQTAADVLIEGIIDWGVDVVFGIPGEGINGIMEALRQR